MKPTMRARLAGLGLLSAGLLAACAAIPPASERVEQAEALAATRGWTSVPLDTDTFTLLAFQPERMAASERLTVYIEGDGFAWITGSRPSTNPTPINPMGLKLSLAHPGGHAAYLARPCQFVNSPDCQTRYWTSHRFAPEIIDASDQALTQLKQHFGAQRLVLVGYSGGGAVAALLAARRDDVERLVTVAGNLDHRAWSELHHVSPLSGSLNAADQIGELTHIPQTHYVGERDAVVPPAIATRFADAFPSGRQPEVVVIPGYDHRCCWQEQWPALIGW